MALYDPRSVCDDNFYQSCGLHSFKDPLILCVGPRRLVVNPIYSQHTRGGGKGANNVHKFERYLRHGATYVATIYCPVVYGKQSCVLLRETSDIQGGPLLKPCLFSALTLYVHSSTTCSHGYFPEPWHDAHCCQTCRSHWSPLQSPQEDGYSPLYVLQLR